MNKNTIKIVGLDTHKNSIVSGYSSVSFRLVTMDFFGVTLLVLCKISLLILRSIS